MMVLLTLAGGRVAEEWIEYDRLELLRQLGIPTGEEEARANGRLVLKMVDSVFNRHDAGAAREFFAPDVVDHNPRPGQAPGLEGVQGVLATYLRAFPDMTLAVDELVTSGDRVALRWTTQGTHRGEFLGIPLTRKRVTTTGIEIFRLEGEAIVERWGNVDQLALLEQLGARSVTLP
jgi:steroid delta-isomerase-like uncharacterized protein